MKTQDLFLAGLVLFILLSFSPASPGVVVTPLYAKLEAEGMVAMHYNDHTYENAPVPEDTKPEPQPPKNVCRCSSNCGRDDCTCQTNGSAGCKPELKAEVVEPVLVQQVLFFTMKGCAPCEYWKNHDMKTLVDAGWTVGTEPRTIIRVVDIADRPDLWEKYSQGAGVPQFVLLNRGKVVSSHVGYVNYLTVAGMLKK